MKVIAYTQDGVLNLELIGELDHHVAEQTRKELDNCISSSYEGDVVINMSNVSFMDSSGLGVLLGRYKRVAAKGNRMYLYGANKTVDKLLKMSGIYSLIERL